MKRKIVIVLAIGLLYLEVNNLHATCRNTYKNSNITILSGEQDKIELRPRSVNVKYTI